LRKNPKKIIYVRIVGKDGTNDVGVVPRRWQKKGNHSKHGGEEFRDDGAVKKKQAKLR